MRDSYRWMSAKRVFRIATLFVPALLAWVVALTAPHRDELARVVTEALLPFWIVMASAVVIRVAVALDERHRQQREGGEIAPVLARIDVLTTPGTSMAWLSAFSIMGAIWVGWASLAVVGMLGTGVFDIVVLFALFFVRRTDVVFRDGGTITRRFSPNPVTEGEDVIEEIVFANIRVPIGTRLFVTGRLGPRWATSRHIIEATESNAEIVVESEVGPAVRGDHEAERLEMWLQDSFGLTRTMSKYVGAARLKVLPKSHQIAKVAPLLDHGIGAHTPRSTKRLPTEGSFNLREYHPGDDVRRIHWVRSVAARELIVRLPDEVPPDRPRVRLVLDTYFPEAFGLACDSPAEMLDRLVSVWLATAHALAETGVRVTLVTAARMGSGERIGVKRHELSLRAASPALHLGAEVEWQGQMQVDQLLTDEATFIVSRAVLIQPPASPNIRWIVVAPPNPSEMPWPHYGARFPFPMGHPENRGSYRRRAVDEVVRTRSDESRALLAMQIHVAPPPPGSLAAYPVGDQRSFALQVIS